MKDLSLGAHTFPTTLRPYPNPNLTRPRNATSLQVSPRLERFGPRLGTRPSVSFAPLQSPKHNRPFPTPSPSSEFGHGNRSNSPLMASSSVLGALFLIFGGCVELSGVVFCADDVALLLQVSMIARWGKLWCLAPIVWCWLIDWLIGERVGAWCCGLLFLCSTHNTVHTDRSWRWGFALDCVFYFLIFELVVVEVKLWRCCVLTVVCWAWLWCCWMMES